MSCFCTGEYVAFSVPEDLREFAPHDADVLVICPTCLEVSRPRDSPDPDGDFSRIVEGFPEGTAGVAMALAVGLLAQSLALNREAVADLFERVQAEGADPWLVLERLAAAPRVSPDFDIDRSRRQLEQLVG